MKKLEKAIKETQQIQQDFGPVVAKLKENMDDMTLTIAQMKTSIGNLQGVIGIETETGSGSPPGVRRTVSILNSKDPSF